MYKIINILLFMSIINTITFAETTREDVDNYLNISRGGEIVKDRFLLRYKTCFSKIYGISIKNADKKTLEKYDTFILNPKFREDFYNTLGQLDDNTYYEIIAFYKTKLGKKYTKAFKELYEKDIREALMTLIFQKKDKLLIPKKRKLVTEINKVLYSKLHIDLENDIFVVGANQKILKKKEGKTSKIMLGEFIGVFNELAYKDFSDEELTQILEYAKIYGKIEMGFLHHALKLNIEHFKRDLEEYMKKEKNTKSNTNKSK